jgi:hypothetical protein
MKIRYFITGLILIILGFSAFTFIAVLNRYVWMNVTYHILVTIIGFIFIGIGSICMNIFLHQKIEISPKKDNIVQDKVK